MKIEKIGCFSVVVLFCSTVTASGVASHSPLAGTTWEWAGTITPTKKITTEHPENYLLEFHSDEQVKLKVDCNNGYGNYEESKNLLSFESLALTRRACIEESQDREFLSGLEQVRSYYQMNDQLFLEFQYDSGTMLFNPTGD